MPRYVLLYHECPPGYERPSHWDLMLEADPNLRTWAMARLPRGWEAAREQTARVFPACPATAAETEVTATRLADHRIDYLQEEGPLTANRGQVRRIDAGSYETIASLPEAWRVELSGGLLRGQISLQEHLITTQ
jgi:hypothetical protein